MRSPEMARRAGASAGQYLSDLGVNVNFAPVADVARPGSALATRSFGNSPQAVASRAGAFAEGLDEGGVAPTAKHFPGLGRASVNTDQAAVAIQGSRQELLSEASAFEGVATPLVMMSNATYPALDGDNIAVFSPRIIGLLRQQAGFDRVVVTDDLEADAIRNITSSPQAAERAIRAGADLALFAKPGERSAEAFGYLRSVARRDPSFARSVRRAYERVVDLKHSRGL
jgi:beta-N-acetylhexosaminidase